MNYGLNMESWFSYFILTFFEDTSVFFFSSSGNTVGLFCGKLPQFLFDGNNHDYLVSPKEGRKNNGVLGILKGSEIKT